MKVQLICPEGWSYITWQRLLVLDERGRSLARELAAKLNAALEPGVDSPAWVGLLPGDPAEPDLECLFVESGESFGLCDFAANVADLMGWAVTFNEGEP